MIWIKRLRTLSRSWGIYLLNSIWYCIYMGYVITIIGICYLGIKFLIYNIRPNQTTLLVEDSLTSVSYSFQYTPSITSSALRGVFGS